MAAVPGSQPSPRCLRRETALTSVRPPSTAEGKRGDKCRRQQLGSSSRYQPENSWVGVSQSCGAAGRRKGRAGVKKGKEGMGPSLAPF